MAKPSPKLGQRRGTKQKKRSDWVFVAIAVSFSSTLFVVAAVLLFKTLPSRDKSLENKLRGSIDINTEDASVQDLREDFAPLYPRVTRSSSSVSVLSQDALNMCGRALWHTLETTTVVLPDGETFIHTGDIDDLWLRDSAAQIHPLLVPWFKGGALVNQDERLKRIVSGLIKRTALYIRHDPYANAFRIDDTYIFNEEQKRLGRHDLISTWNYELDSGCYFMRMLYFFYRAAPDSPVLREDRVREAVEIMIDVWTVEQDHEGDAFPTGPLFDCKNCGKPYRYPGLPRDGKGSPVSRTGMTWTGFRPSDDECEYGFLVPANMFAVVVLRYMAELAPVLWKDKGGIELGARAEILSHEIDGGIKGHAIVAHPVYGPIYAYEVDGLGGTLLMDDANVPSLMSIPYLGYDFDPEIYANTRRFILSEDNPTYQRGSNKITGEIEGYGSPHMAQAVKRNIWPMSLAVQGLTSDDESEKIRLIEKLVKASAGTGWMHESFDVNNPKRFTRSWFCWADSLFAELVLSVTDECPQARDQYHVMSWRDPIDVKGAAYSAV